jgi:hypothetical protein
MRARDRASHQWRHTGLALARYEATRDRLSLKLFETADRLASHAWGDDEIDVLARRISSATSAEVELLAGLDLPVCQREHIAAQLDREPESLAAARG